MIVSDSVERYLHESRSPPDELLREMEEHGEREGIPVVMPETGSLLHVLARACAARRVVEVGTAIGVSTLHLARALPAGGTVVSFEIDAGRHEAACGYLRRAGLLERTDLRLLDATEGLQKLEPESYDMAFLDGLKSDYPRQLELTLELLRPGGVLAVDNALLSGTVADGRPAGNWSQQHIDMMRSVNQRVLHDPALAASLVPVGDGLLVAVPLGLPARA